jgi:hypothetical protein
VLRTVKKNVECVAQIRRQQKKEEKPMPTPTVKEQRKVQTTLRLPRPLYEQAKDSVEKGYTVAETINDFFVAAIRAYLKMLRRKRIDAAFAPMAEDADYQKEVQIIAEEFAKSDWESLEVDQQSEGETHATR